MQSTWENVVRYNLSESGVHPMRLRELAGGAEWSALLDQELGYTQSNGTPALRECIANLYPGATPDHIEVTNGGSEANFIVSLNLVEPGDEVVVMVPNYMQTYGLARAFGGDVRPWSLVSNGGPWRADLARLEAMLSHRTKLIVVCTPNNPTGARMTDQDLEEICELAARHGSWILSDEIYRGAELDGRETPSMWGRYERVVISSGLSKAYGLPGLRIGWIAGPPSLVESLWSYHDYTTIAPGALSDRLARVALAPDTRARILERTRAILRENLAIVRAWLDSHGDQFSYVPPEAGAIIYVRYRLPINSTTLVNRLRVEKSVLIVPGDHFGMDGYLRLGYGSEPDYLKAGLSLVDDLLASLQPEPARF